MTKKIHLQKVAGSGNPDSVCGNNANKYGNVELDYLTVHREKATCAACRKGVQEWKCATCRNVFPMTSVKTVNEKGRYICFLNPACK